MRILSTVAAWLLVACGSAEESPPEQPQGVAIAVAFEGSWGWLGNELYERSLDQWRYGAFQHLRVAIEAAFAELPPNAETAIIAYDGAHGRIALPMGPLRPRSSATLGAQRDYERNITIDLAGGIRVGMDELARSTAPRKLLVIVGSGSVMNRDVDVAKLVELRAEAERAHTETIAIVLPSEYAEDYSHNWTDNVVTVRSSWELVDALRAVARSTHSRRSIAISQPR